MNVNHKTQLFDDYHKRFFFFFGKTDDEFCIYPFGILRLEECLHHYLQTKGYTRILFFNGSQKLYFYDHCSYTLCQPNAFTPQKTSPSSTKSRICPGPLGMKKIQSPNQASQSQTPPREQVQSESLCYGQAKDQEMVGVMHHCMRDTKIKSALIFTDGLDFLIHTDSEAIRHMGGNLIQWSKEFSTNQNICIFIFPSISFQDLDILLQRNPQWSFLKSRMINSGSGSHPILTPEMMDVGYPQKEEVSALVHYYRLTRNLSIDWQAFNALHMTLCRKIATDNSYLKELSAQLNQAKALSKDLLETLAGKHQSLSAMDRLCSFKGLDSVVVKMKQFISQQNETDHQKQRPIADQASHPCARVFMRHRHAGHGKNIHLILTGNPGTGKTMCASLIGEIFRDAGLLESGHMIKASRHDLVAGYVGQTAIQTMQKITQAMGGVLFIDEAYRLTEGGEGDFGKEAVETIMEAMTQHMGEFSVIAAGYPEKINVFLDANPGLKSRFSPQNVIHIPDYSPDILHHIFEQKVRENHRYLSTNLARLLPAFIKNWHEERNPINFGNARDVINLYEEMDRRRSTRVIDMEVDKDHRNEMITDDVPDRFSHLLKPVQVSMEHLMASLDELIGLERVKRMVKTMMNQMRVNQLRKQNVDLAPGHYTFVGHPGTGKTTVARLMGKMFKSLGILKGGHLVETGRSDLVAGYSGQTALKTRAVLEQSLDGVLFIDEAYQLVEDDRDTFGKEALETLVAFMENHRDRLCIIAAGYPEPMRRFIAQNPGLPSRFTSEIEFDNYSSQEMLHIFQLMATQRNMSLAEGLEQKLIKRFEHMIQFAGPYFGNARDVRKILDSMIANQSNRLAEMPELDTMDQVMLNRLEINDLQ